MTQRYKIIIEYDGTDFVGWQRQQNAMSVQEAIEDAIFALTKEKVSIHAAGRTDAGVHAIGQVAHFDLDSAIDTHKLSLGLNHFIRPHNISIINCEEVDNTFHARFSARKRHYKYIILNRSAPPALEKNRVWHLHRKLNIAIMQSAAGCLVGRHDFSSFRATECQAKSPVKTLDRVDIVEEGEFIIFHVSSRSFLHHMVRNIVGTLKEVGEGKIKPEEIKNILLACDRKAAGVTAPPYGLYFIGVDYDVS